MGGTSERDLLTFADGQQYVGSAAGEEGFWQR